MKQEDFKVENIKINLEDFSFVTKFYPTIFNTKNIETKPQDKKMKSYSSLLEYEKEIVNNTNNLSKVLKFIATNKVLLAAEFSKLLDLEENKKIKNIIDKNKLLKIGVYKLFPQFPHNKKLIKVSKNHLYRVARFKEQKLPDYELLEHLIYLAKENNIPAPTQEQINKIETIDNMENQQIENDKIIARTSYYLSSILEKNRATSEKEKLEKIEFIKALYSSENLEKNLRQEVQKHYKNINLYIEEVKNNQKDFFDFIRKELEKQKKFKGQPTYHSLFNGARKKQRGTILEIRNKEKEEERNLLVDLIMSDNDLNDAQKLEAINNIVNEDLDSEINRWLGKKLTKQERRILRVLRYIIYQMIEQEEITGIGKSIYEAEIPLSRIYEEYGLEKRDIGGYQYKQTKIIQDVLFGISTKGLHEDILFKHTTIMKTRFILQIEKIQQKVIGIDRVTSIRIAMPHFLFVSDKKANSFYYEDKEGLKKFTAIKGMSQSDAAFDIVEYLECFLSSKLKERSLNQSTLIEEGGVELQKRFKTHKGEVLETIETILNNMVEAGYLLKGWRLEKGKYGQPQYTFENLRYELFIAGKSKCEVKKLPTKTGTKNRKKY